MAAYVISDLQVRDSALIAEYRPLAAQSIAHYGGRYLARGGTIHPIEGGWAPESIVVVEFPSMQRAHEWFDSPEYAAARAIAERALSRRLIFVEGVAPTSPA
jgi:uncharacterized protein (DUF1330 family)